MKGFIRTCVFTALLCCSTANPLYAQDPFSSISLGAGGGVDLGQGRFQERISTGTAFSVFARVPFHVGGLEAGIAGSRSAFRDKEGPDFWSALLHAGWGPAYDVTPNLHAGIFLVAGNYFMMFDTAQLGYARRENELMLGASGGLTYFAIKDVGVFARVGYARVFTSTAIDFIQVSAGLAVRMAMPPSIRTLLR